MVSLTESSRRKGGKNEELPPAAENYITLYKLVDAANSEAWYFSAIIHAADKNTTEAKADLLKAISNGFNDKARLLHQQEFTGISLDEISGRIK